MNIWLNQNETYSKLPTASFLPVNGTSWLFPLFFFQCTYLNVCLTWKFDFEYIIASNSKQATLSADGPTAESYLVIVEKQNVWNIKDASTIEINESKIKTNIIVEKIVIYENIWMKNILIRIAVLHIKKIKKKRRKVHVNNKIVTHTSVQWCLRASKSMSVRVASGPTRMCTCTQNAF